MGAFKEYFQYLVCPSDILTIPPTVGETRPGRGPSSGVAGIWSWLQMPLMGTGTLETD